MQKAVLGLLFLVHFLCLHAQERDSLFTKHSPKKAALLSAILPGAGQVYNHIAMPKGQKKAYWKVPLFYGLIGGTGYLLVTAEQQRSAMRTEIISRRSGNKPSFLPNYSDYALSSAYIQQRSQRDRMIIAFAASYGLCVLDAFIEAHFVDFDVSKDLSLKVRPQIGQSNGLVATIHIH